MRTKSDSYGESRCLTASFLCNLTDLLIYSNSFTEAAEEYHVSQSAISQQIQALEKELGVKLLERKNRKFILTPAGEHFYRRSLILTSDLERLRCETLRLAHRDEARLTVGYLRRYSGAEFHAAVADFSQQYPDVQLNRPIRKPPA